MNHESIVNGMPETAPILRAVRATQPIWAEMVRLSVGAAVVLCLTVSAVVVNEVAGAQQTMQRIAQHAAQPAAVADSDE